MDDTSLSEINQTYFIEKFIQSLMGEAANLSELS